jgi:hypothetical protein
MRNILALMAVGAYHDDTRLPPIPVAVPTAHALRSVLLDRLDLDTEPEVRLLADPATTDEMARFLVSAADDATGLLLLYYCGHGLRTFRGHLTLSHTRTKDPDFEALEYAKVRQALMRTPSSRHIVVLDCCYSGSALTEGMLGDLCGQVQVPGAFVLASSPADEESHVLRGEGMTAFTKRLIEVLGPATQPPVRTLNRVLAQLRARLRDDDLPRPEGADRNELGEVVLFRERPRGTDLESVAAAVLGATFTELRDQIAGVAETIASIASRLGLPDAKLAASAARLRSETLRLTLVGHFYSGKSTLGNALLEPTTALPVRGRLPLTVDVLPPCEVTTMVTNGAGDEPPDDTDDGLTVSFPAQLCHAGVTLVDTPGLNSSPEADAEALRRAGDSHALIFVTSGDMPLPQVVLDYLEAVLHRAPRSSVWVVVAMRSNKVASDRLDRYLRKRLAGLRAADEHDLADRVIVLDVNAAVSARAAARADDPQLLALYGLEQRLGEYLSTDGLAVWRTRSTGLVHQLAAALESQLDRELRQTRTYQQATEADQRQLRDVQDRIVQCQDALLKDVLLPSEVRACELARSEVARLVEVMRAEVAQSLNRVPFRFSLMASPFRQSLKLRLSLAISPWWSYTAFLLDDVLAEAGQRCNEALAAIGVQRPVNSVVQPDRSLTWPVPYEDLADRLATRIAEAFPGTLVTVSAYREGIDRVVVQLADRLADEIDEAVHVRFQHVASVVEALLLELRERGLDDLDRLGRDLSGYEARVSTLRQGLGGVREALSRLPSSD